VQPLTRYALLALLGASSHLTFVRPTPINWDAVQFALALDQFDLHAHQPHPPGYILYVLMGKALLPLVGNPALTLSLMSVALSAIALPLIYWLASEVVEDQVVALCAAILWLASPLVLYYGSVGLTYLPEAVLSMAVASLAWKTRVVEQGRDKTRPNRFIAPSLLGIALGIAGGVRQTTLLVLLSLCVWALWGRCKGEWLAFGVAFAGVSLLWLIPLLLLSGGPDAYLRENALLAQTVAERTSIFDAGLEGLAHNLTFEALGLALGLGFGLIPLGVWAMRLIRFRLSPKLKGLVIWWTVPALLFYAVSHIGQYGYLLMLIPPLILLSAASARVLGQKLALNMRTSPSRLSLAICALLAVMSAAYFAMAEGPITAAGIKGNDAHLSALRQALSGMNPASTVLVTSVDWNKPFRLTGYAIPNYHVYAYGENQDESLGWLYAAYGGKSTYALPHPSARKSLDLPEGTRRIISLDDDTADLLKEWSGRALQSVSLADGSTLYILDSGGVPIPALTIANGVQGRSP